MTTYNLIDEAWIPILRKDGSKEQVGLKTALLQAHEIQEVYGDTPLETASLYRLLLALYLRIFPEQDEEDAWFDQRDQAAFDHEKVVQYFQKWHHRLDLLDERRPFYQTPHPLKSDKGADFINPIEKLFTEEASNNNPVFYSHTSEAQQRLIPLDKAARGIVVTQAYSIGGGVAKPFNFANAPMLGTALFWVRGKNLFEMLLKNAPPGRECRRLSSVSGVRDAPTWEKDLPRWEERALDGYLDYLTWQSRALKLVTQLDNGHVFASAVLFHQGDKLASNVSQDPLLAYKTSKDSRPYALSFAPEKALWRDATIFLNLSSDHGQAPAVFDGLEAVDEENFAWETDVLGMSNDQGTVNFLRQERMPIYTCFFGEDRDRYRHTLSTMIQYAEEQRDNLRWATKTLCEWILAPPKEGEPAPKADAGAVGKLLAHFDTLSRYWAALETPFYQVMDEVAKMENTATAHEQKRTEWGETVFRIAKKVFTETTQSFEASARALRAITEGERCLMRVKALRLASQPTADKPKKGTKQN